MIDKKFKRGGFTLVELLVVVAIIGILATVVLTALGSSKKKGNDAAVKSNLDTIRSVSEIFYSDNGNLYLPSGGATFTLATCPVYNAAGTNMFAVNKLIASAITEAVKRGSGSACYNSVMGWAVAVGLTETANTSWCVDSGGTARMVPSVPLSAITAGVCN